MLLLQWIEAGAPYGVAAPPPPQDPQDFEADVVPIFENRNCTGCHYAGNNDLDLTAAPADIFAYIVDYQLYDIQYPDRSKLLMEPYCGNEGKCDDNPYGQVHPTEVFYTEYDPDYIKILQWVAQGAIYDYVPVLNPVLEVNVDFATKVQYRFATRGCIGCHGSDAPSAGLDLTDRWDNVRNYLIDPAATRVVPGYEADSYIVTKPNYYYVDVNHDGGKVIPGIEDPYQLYVGGWVYEGANEYYGQVYTEPDFQTQVYPLFQTLGCTGCHDAQAQGGLDLDQAGDYAAVCATITGDQDIVYATYSDRSYLLTKTFDVFAEAHDGGKKVTSQYYNEYTTLTQWIEYGANLVPQ